VKNVQKQWLIFFFFFFYLDGSGYLACAHSELFNSEIILQTVGRTPWTGDQPVARPLPTQDKTNI
jgi:hypothetical protein